MLKIIIATIFVYFVNTGVFAEIITIPPVNTPPIVGCYNSSNCSNPLISNNSSVNELKSQFLGTYNESVVVFDLSTGTTTPKNLKNQELSTDLLPAVAMNLQIAQLSKNLKNQELSTDLLPAVAMNLQIAQLSKNLKNQELSTDLLPAVAMNLQIAQLSSVAKLNKSEPLYISNRLIFGVTLDPKNGTIDFLNFGSGSNNLSLGLLTYILYDKGTFNDIIGNSSYDYDSSIGSNSIFSGANISKISSRYISTGSNINTLWSSLTQSFNLSNSQSLIKIGQRVFGVERK